MIRTEYHLLPIVIWSCVAIYLLYRYIKNCIKNNKKRK